MRTRILFLVSALLLLSVSCLHAQVNVKLSWDYPGSSDPDNPVQFRLSDCSNETLATCNNHETATAMTYGPIALAHGSTTWFYVIAWNYQLGVDGKPGGTVQESGKSNVLRVKAFAPPGNPANQRIQVTEILRNGTERDVPESFLVEIMR